MWLIKSFIHNLHWSGFWLFCSRIFSCYHVIMFSCYHVFMFSCFHGTSHFFQTEVNTELPQPRSPRTGEIEDIEKLMRSEGMNNTEVYTISLSQSLSLTHTHIHTHIHRHFLEGVTDSKGSKSLRIDQMLFPPPSSEANVLRGLNVV